LILLWIRCYPFTSSSKRPYTPHEQTSLQRQIEATDGQIDALVCKLYGLTEEEIRIVDGT